MINLEKFAEEKTIIAPIVNNRFIYNRKKYAIEMSDGWYRLSVINNKARSVEPVFIELIHDQPWPIIKGYTYNNQIVCQNIDVAKRKFNLEVLSPLYLNQAPTFTSIEAIVYEDKCLYYYRPNYEDMKIYEVKSCYDAGDDIRQLKGITPELKMLYLFHFIEKENIKKEQEKKSVPGRLKDAFKRVGAELLNYSISGKRIVVDWRLESSGINFNSVIDAETFMIIEAGYCMSGDDRRHNITSLVLTAQDYEEGDLIHLTRE